MLFLVRFAAIHHSVMDAAGKFFGNRPAGRKNGGERMNQERFMMRGLLSFIEELVNAILRAVTAFLQGLGIDITFDPIDL